MILLSFPTHSLYLSLTHTNNIGTTRLEGLLHSDDTQVMMRALELLGASFVWEQDAKILKVRGVGGKFRFPEKELYLSNAGTASRFLTSVATLVPCPKGKCVVVTGNERAQERPILQLVKALRQHGCDIDYRNNEGFLPLEIKGTGLRGGEFKISGKITVGFKNCRETSHIFAVHQDDNCCHETVWCER